jgi:hypothetical protein
VMRTLFFHIALFLLFLSVLSGCGDNQGEKYKNLTDEQKAIAYEAEKKKIVYDLICSGFREEIHNYKLDRKKKEFLPWGDYFPDYPYQFNILKSDLLYEQYKIAVKSRLKMRGIRGYDAEFKSWGAPSIRELPCQDDVDEWLNLRREWHAIRNNLPPEFYKQRSIWDDISYYFNYSLEKIEKAFYAFVAFLLIAFTTIYSIVLHQRALLRKITQGWWFVVTTPLSALYWQKHISSLLGWSLPYWSKVFVASLILSVIYFLIALISQRLFAPREGDLERAIENSDLKGVARILDWDIEVVNKLNHEGLSPLHLLCLKTTENSREDHWIAVHLIKKGADVNLTSGNKNEWSPIHYIAAQGVDTRPSHLKVLDVLLDNGATVEAKAPRGWTPLHLIAINGAKESIGVLEKLIAHRANPFAIADDGITTWRMLWQHGEEVFEALDQYEKRYENGK